MLRTLIQLNSITVTIIATFFWIRGAALISYKAIADLAGTYFGYNQATLESLAAQKADSFVAGVLLAISFILQTINSIWQMRANDLKVDRVAEIWTLIIFILIFGISLLGSWLYKKNIVFKAKTFLSKPELLEASFDNPYKPK